MLETARVQLDRITCPVLIMTAAADHLVSPAASLGLVPHICSRDVKIMSLAGGHESLAVSSKAHQTFWPEAAQWIADHSTPATGPCIRPGEECGWPAWVGLFSTGRSGKHVFPRSDVLNARTSPRRPGCFQTDRGGEVIMNIQGKCAIVTGAASGIGQAVAVELAERGRQGGGACRPLGGRPQGRPDDQRSDGDAAGRSHDRRHDRRGLPAARRST